MIINFERPRLNRTSTKNFTLEARAVDYMRGFLEDFTSEPLPPNIPDISCEINTIRAGSQPWFWVAEVLLIRININLQISRNTLSIKTSTYAFPLAPPIYLAGLNPGTGDGVEGKQLDDLNDYFTRAGFPQED